MTDAKQKKDDKPLDKMTVKELREVAKEVTDLTGVSGMKKEELLVALKAVQGEAADADATPEDKDGAQSAPKAPAAAKEKGAANKEKVPLTVQEMKALIKTYKVKRRQALEAKDRTMATIVRRRISRLKKKTRKAA